jgi:hypothetical protein
MYGLCIIVLHKIKGDDVMEMFIYAATFLLVILALTAVSVGARVAYDMHRLRQWQKRVREKVSAEAHQGYTNTHALKR